MDVLLTETEVAEHYGVTTRTVQKWRKSGAGPQFLSLGANSIRYRTEDIRAYDTRSATGGEIPERARIAMKRAASFLALIAEWKIEPETRKHIGAIRDELRDLTAKPVGRE